MIKNYVRKRLHKCLHDKNIFARKNNGQKLLLFIFWSFKTPAIYLIWCIEVNNSLFVKLFNLLNKDDYSTTPSTFDHFATKFSINRRKYTTSFIL